MRLVAENNETIILHNPKCSKSREALELLRKNNIDPLIIEYLKKPLSIQEIEKVLQLLNAHPTDIIRKNESFFKDNLKHLTLERDHLLQVLAENPILIERPICIRGKKAVLGRPPEKVLDLI